jgi:hypothetical protein
MEGHIAFVASKNSLELLVEGGVAQFAVQALEHALGILLCVNRPVVAVPRNLFPKIIQKNV